MYEDFIRELDFKTLKRVNKSFVTEDFREKNRTSFIPLISGKNSFTFFSKLIEQTIPERYIPTFEYYAIIENEIPKESLKRIKNAVSAVFYIENLDENRIKEEIDNIVEIIRDEDLEKTKQFADFFNNFLENKSELLDREYLSHKIEDAMEVKTMLTTTLQNIREKGIQEGRQEGKVEVVLSMDKNGVPVDRIALYTGLGEEKIREILKERKSNSF